MYVAIKEDVAGDDISNIVKTLVVSAGIMVLTLIKLLLYSHQYSTRSEYNGACSALIFRKF